MSGTDHFEYFPGTGGVLDTPINEFVRNVLEASKDDDDLFFILSGLEKDSNGTYIFKP